MTAFFVPADIGNRAAQHCGAPRMDPTLGFQDTSSRTASETGFVYDKMRETELRKRYWSFAIKRTALRAIDNNAMLIAPSLWSPFTTYFANSIVADQSGNLWISNIPNNLGNDPLLTTFWEPYFGPMTAALYASGTGYYSGELVYTTPGDGTNKVYLSLVDGNTDVPGTATPWDNVTTFFKNQVVTFSSIAYMSLIDLNINNEPDLAPALFNISTTYSAGNKVGGSDGFIYTSIGSGNIGHDPTLDGGIHWTNTGVLNPWTTVFVGGSGSDKWLQIGGSGSPSGVALKRIGIVYPTGAGPSTNIFNRNVFRLPSGYLRRAPQNPKGTTAPLGGPAGFTYDDWNLENGYLISAETGPILLRFVGNFSDVARMDADFCEAVAARIAVAVCEPLTQSQAKLQTVTGIFKKWEEDARTIDGIEQGYVDPPDDDFIAVRA